MIKCKKLLQSTIVLFLALTACGGGGGGSSSGSGSQAITLNGAWNGSLNARYYSCSGKIKMNFRETGRHIQGSVSGRISGAACGSRTIKANLEGTTSGNAIDLTDTNGDQWTLNLYDKNTITGQYFSERLLLNFDVSLRR